MGDLTVGKEKVFNYIAQGVNAIRNWWGSNKEIGTYYNVFSRDEDWGIRDGYYDGMNVDLMVRYSIRRVYVPQHLKAKVRVYGIRIDSSADSNWHCCSAWTTTGGEFFAWMRVADNFAGNDMAQHITRCPESGTTCVCNKWVKCPTYAKEEFGNRPKYIMLNNDNINGPFLYVEIAGWDEDNPSVGDDHDPLGTVAKAWLLDEDNFDWDISSLRPMLKTINRMVSVRGVSGGKMTVDLGVEIQPE